MNCTDSRSLEILDAVVRLNVETGKPVSSGLVERFLVRSVSSATIRNVMKSLEDGGFLHQPHTSAGRLPTDKGFRVFVDRLRRGWALQYSEVPEEMRVTARRDLAATAGHPDRVRLMAGLLSRLTRNISIIVGPSLDDVVIQRIELYPRSASRVLMVVIMASGQVKTGLVVLRREHGALIITQAARLISDRIRNRTVGDVRRGLLENLDLVPTPVTRCAADIAHGGKDLFQDAERGEVQLEGVNTLLDEPEFEQPGPLKALLRFIESPAMIHEALRTLDEGAEGEVRVWIGGENPLGSLREFSVLTGRFAMDGRQGRLAVLGPRRMWYQRALQGIDAVRQIMSASSL